MGQPPLSQGGLDTGGRAGYRLTPARRRQPTVREQLVGQVVLKEVNPVTPKAEVGYWTAAHARGRRVAPRALEALTSWAFDTFGAYGLERLELLHQVDNLASCRVAQKSRYALGSILPAAPPSFPRDGHLHVRRLSAGHGETSLRGGGRLELRPDSGSDGAAAGAVDATVTELPGPARPDSRNR